MPEDNVTPENYNDAFLAPEGDALDAAAADAADAAAGAVDAATSAADAAATEASTVLDEAASDLASTTNELTAEVSEPILDFTSTADSAPESVVGETPVNASADSALDQLANALAGEPPAATEAPVATQPFSTPNVQTEPISDPTRAASAEPQQTYDPAAQAVYAQTQQPYDPNQQPFSAQPQYNADPNQQPYGQPQYAAVPGAPQYGQQASNPGTVPMVLGILSIVAATILGFTFIGPIAGIVLGAIGISKGSKVLRSDPANGRAKGGKITGIIGLILSILALLFTIIITVVLGMAAVSALENPESLVQNLEEIAATDETGQLQEEVDNLKEQLGMTDGSTGGATGGSGTGASTGAEDGAFSADEYTIVPAFTRASTGDDEADVKALTEDVMKAITNPTAEQSAKIDAYIDEEISFILGASLDELGITREDFKKWADGGNLKYSIGDTTAASSYGWSDVKVEVRDAYQFFDVLDEALQSNEQDVTKIMRTAMDGTGMTERTITVDAIQQDGEWVVSEDTMNYLYGVIYGLY